MKVIVLCAALLMVLCWIYPIPAYASGFADYEGGILRIEPPRKIKIYKKSTSTAKIVSIGATQYSIQDARWQGSELVVTLVEENGRQTTRVYKDTASYRTIR